MGARGRRERAATKRCRRAARRRVTYRSVRDRTGSGGERERDRGIGRPPWNDGASRPGAVVLDITVRNDGSVINDTYVTFEGTMWSQKAPCGILPHCAKPHTFMTRQSTTPFVSDGPVIFRPCRRGSIPDELVTFAWHVIPDRPVTFHPVVQTRRSVCPLRRATSSPVSARSAPDVPAPCPRAPHYRPGVACPRSLRHYCARPRFRSTSGRVDAPTTSRRHARLFGFLDVAPFAVARGSAYLIRRRIL